MIYIIILLPDSVDEHAEVVPGLCLPALVLVII